MTQPPADEAAPLAGEQASGIAGSMSAPAVPGQAIDFAALVSRLESSLLRYVGQLLGRADPDLEDIVQDAFLRLHRQVHEHGDRSVQSASTWLFRVAHNLTMDTLRKRKVRRGAQRNITDRLPSASAGCKGDEAGGHHDDDTLGDMERHEASSLAMTELALLPETQRQALTLKMIEGLTIRQIAQVTDTSIGNVGYRISQGLAELSRRLKKAGVI